VNTLYPKLGPHPDPKDIRPPLENFLPPINGIRTIGDELNEAKPKAVTWAWYSGGWDDAVSCQPGNDAVTCKPDKNFQYHHQPFAYFSNFGPGQPGREHLKDAKKFLDLIEEKAGPGEELPQVVFYKPIGELNEHPGYADVLEGDNHLGGY
jgi:phospholipase C